MEKITRSVEINRYRLITSDDTLYDFLDLFGDILIIYNTNNTGDLTGNFLDADEKFNFEDDTQLIRSDYKFYKVISLYRENGWDGVYSNTTLTKRPNNWVESGRNGLLYVVYSNDESRLNEFVNKLKDYINGMGINYAVYDELEEDTIDWGYSLSDNFDEWRKEVKELYDLEVM